MLKEKVSFAFPTLVMEQELGKKNYLMFVQWLICTENPDKRDLVLLGNNCQPRKEGFKSRAEQNVLNVTVDSSKKKKKKCQGSLLILRKAK